MPTVKRLLVLCRVAVCFVCHDFQWMHEGLFLLDELHVLLTEQTIDTVALSLV